MTKSTQIDGNALVRALRYSPAHFHKLRSELIKNGATVATSFMPWRVRPKLSTASDRSR
jgi:hypothetical protein